MAIIPFTSFLLASTLDMPPYARNSSSPQSEAVRSQPLVSVLTSWKIQLKTKLSNITDWMVGDSSQEFAQALILFAVFLLVVRAFWVWVRKGWEIGRELWEERDRREKFRKWMTEERKSRRDGVAVVGILKGGDEKKVVRKRVSWDKEGRWGWEGKRDSDLEGQRVRFVMEETGIETRECEESAICMDLTVGSQRNSQERPQRKPI